MRKKGFTLIELLVVVAIIGVLASVVLASLNSARGKAKDSAIKQEMLQIRNLMALNHDDYGTYAQLQNGWAFTVADCNAQFNSTYAPKMREICAHIITTGSGGFHSGVHPAIASPNNFSVMAHLPGKGTYFCVGSGGSSDTAPGDGTNWSSPGCYSNP